MYLKYNNLSNVRTRFANGKNYKSLKFLMAVLFKRIAIL